METVVEKMKIEKYPVYKDSGVEWLGEIPEHWQAVSLGSLMELKSDKNHPDYEVLSVYREFGVIKKDSRDDNHNVTSENTTNYKAVEPGDLVVNKMKAWQGSMGVSSYKGIVSPAYITCKITSKNVYSEYLHRLLRSYSYIGEYNRISYGVRVGQWDMHYEDFKRVMVVLPPIEEQIKIANFLDQKTQQIDKAINIKEKQISLLKERKQILIHNAVTKGLNYDLNDKHENYDYKNQSPSQNHKKSKFKDSGVEWIGQIPEHWEVKKLKYILKERIEKSLTGEEPLFMVSQTHGLVVRSDYHEKAEVAQSNVGNKAVYKDDLVFNKLKAHLGVFFKSEIAFKGIVSPDYAVYYSIGLIKDLKYLELLFRTPGYIKEFICRATGIVEGLIRLYTNDLFDIKVPVPPLHEQDNILKYIDSINQKISKAITIKEKEIEKLKEYKATLINSAVTGKIKVS